MTETHYLSLAAPGQVATAPITATLNPFGAADTGQAPGWQNLDVRIYFSADNYVPQAPPPTPYLYSRPGVPIVSTWDWCIFIDPNGCLNYGQFLFYVPGLNDEAGSVSMAVTSTVPIPSANLSPDGLCLRVYVNAYSTGPAGSPGAATIAPNVTFYTSADGGTTWTQFGDSVALPSKTVSFPNSPDFTLRTQPLCGPYFGIWPRSELALSCGGLGRAGESSSEYFTNMQVFAFSMQDSTGRYLAQVDFTEGVTTTPVQPDISIPSYVLLSFTDKVSNRWLLREGATVV